MQRPLIVVTLSYAAGILLGQGLLYFPQTLLILSLAVVIPLFTSVLLRRVALPRFLLFTLPSLAGAAAFLFSAVWTPADHYTRLFPDANTDHMLIGRVSSALDRDPERTAFVLALERMDSAPASGRVRISVREAVTHVGYGDRVKCSAKLFEPRGYQNPGGFDHAAYLKRSGISRMASVRSGSDIEVLEKGTGAFRKIQDWREQIRQAFLASLSGPGSAILQAMVLGEEGMLTDEMRDRFMAAGVTHIISISGSHLGMLAVISFGLMRFVMRLLPARRYHQLTLAVDPRKLAACLTLPLVLFYTLLAGGQMATIRSFIMISAAMAALLLDRDSALLHALGSAGLFMLIASPQALFDISFQLSFLSVWTIGSVVRLWNELEFKPRGRTGRMAMSVLLLVVISLSTALATGPLVARYFNQVSLAGLLSNMIVVPFAGLLVVPLGLVSGVLSLFLGYLPMAGLNQFLADWFVKVVTFFSGLPLAEFHPPAPGVLWLSCYACMIVSLFAIVRSLLRSRYKPFTSSARVPRRPVLLALVSVAALLLLSGRTLLSSSTSEVCFPDVGQGDAALVTLRGNRHILVDGGGTYDDRFDVGRRVLAPYLWDKGVRSFDLVVLSHPHPDHMNGLKFILQKFSVAEVWTHGLDTDLPGYDGFIRTVRERKIPHAIVSAGRPAAAIGEAELQVLHPAAVFSSGEKKEYAAENDRSMVLKIKVNGRALLLPGDIGRGAEAELVRAGKDIACDVIKAPHHGSRSSSSEQFVRAAGPKVVVFTVGRGNRYRHPSPDVVDVYERAGAAVLRTDQDGAVCVQLDKEGLREMKWTGRALRQIVPRGSAGDEGENLRRLWIRKWEL